MAPSKIRRAIGAVKDQTSIGLAKVGNSDSLSDLDVAIVKATRHEEYPADEKHIREILSLTSYARSHVSACVCTISRRLNKTKNWTVALKTLMLIQRLLNDGDPAYEQEIFFATRRGTRLLNMSDFRDASHSDSWNYSAFVRSYALYLDERLEFRMQGKRGKRIAFGFDEEEEEEEEVGLASAKGTPLCEMSNDVLFPRVHRLRQLLERFLACRPTGEAKENRVVIVALYLIVKDSFLLYYDITELLGVLLDRFMELDVSEAISVQEIFCKMSKQLDELDKFYCWSKGIGIARSSEYPDVEKITQRKLELMEEFIREKSASAQSDRGVSPEPEEEIEEDEENEDMNAIKALPPPESVSDVPVEVEEEAKQEETIETNTQLEADLLNLGEDAVSSEDHSNSLALALFDGAAPAGPPAASPWQAFGNDTADWETALVESASHLSSQQSALGGGFDTLLLDGMYQQGAIAAAMSAPGSGTSGSASSVALGSAGKPAALALPAPPTKDGVANPVIADPFAASLAVPPPAYVQMREMENKQRLLVEEQLMWQQYARDGMQGMHALEQIQRSPYNTGGYSRGY